MSMIQWQIWSVVNFSHCGSNCSQRVAHHWLLLVFLLMSVLFHLQHRSERFLFSVLKLADLSVVLRLSALM